MLSAGNASDLNGGNRPGRMIRRVADAVLVTPASVTPLSLHSEAEAIMPYLGPSVIVRLHVLEVG